MQTGIKTPQQLDNMRTGGKILAQILKDIRGAAIVGTTELQIDQFARKKIKEYGATPAYLDSAINFPAAICVSVNEQLVHSIPTDRPLEEGDKASFDLTINYRGVCVDSAFTMIIGGDSTGAARHLLTTTEKSLMAGIDTLKHGVKTGDIGYAIEKVLTRGKLGVITDYVGHGIGTKMHLPPNIPNFGSRGTGVMLSAGDTICIEPMASLGKPKTRVTEDGWTVAMADHSLCAHFEHTLLITENGAEILTAP